MKSPKYQVRPVHRGELATVAGLDQFAYGGYAVDAAGLTAWWERYRRGIYVLLDQQDVIGAVGLWPITRDAFDGLVQGKMDERELTASSICGDLVLKSHRYWYVGDIILREDHRDRHPLTGRLVLLLLRDMLSAWVESGHVASTVELCALGFERGGSLLRQFGFTHDKDSPGGVPVYTRTLTLQELEKQLHGLTSRLKTRR